MASTPKRRERKQRTAALLETPDTLSVIVGRVASGAMLSDITREWDVAYNVVAAWLDADETRLAAYEAAVKTREQHHRDKITGELLTMIDADIAGAFDGKGNLLPIDQIPEAVRKCISALECDAGVLKRVRFHDKLRGLEILARSLRMLIDRSEHTVEQVSLAELLSADPPWRHALPEAPKAALGEAPERGDDDA